MPLMIRSVRGV